LRHQFLDRNAMSYGRPEYIDEVMVAFPGLRVCASLPGWPWVTELIGVCWRHPTHIGVLAVRPKLLAKPHSGYEPLLQYGRSILKDKIIFGSSFPMMSPVDAIAEIDALGLDVATRQMLHDNAARSLLDSVG
jgi:predicted TIM-barrel fold metal-dependent hydrolase